MYTCIMYALSNRRLKF